MLSIQTGDVWLQSFKHQLHRSKKIDFIEQFNEKLLVKQVLSFSPSGRLGV
jgi:(p)ppGpp synthase/HD superfamily hydrolase